VKCSNRTALHCFCIYSANSSLLLARRPFKPKKIKYETCKSFNRAVGMRGCGRESCRGTAASPSNSSSMTQSSRCVSSACARKPLSGSGVGFLESFLTPDYSHNAGGMCARPKIVLQWGRSLFRSFCNGQVSPAEASTSSLLDTFLEVYFKRER
jgi:hypothetical protein